jgi:hypothetical protein
MITNITALILRAEHYSFYTFVEFIECLLTTESRIVSCRYVLYKKTITKSEQVSGQNH